MYSSTLPLCNKHRFDELKKKLLFLFSVKLKGMNEHMARVTLKNADLDIPKFIFEIANVTRVITDKENTFR